MSAHSTSASRSMFASMRSASRCRCSARPAGPSAAQAGNASCAARTAWSTSSSPARATSSSTDPSIGEIVSKLRSLATRRPAMKCSIKRAP